MKHKGNALFQYVIILALVGLALTPVFMSVGEKIVDILQEYTTVFEANNVAIKGNTAPIVSTIPSQLTITSLTSTNNSIAVNDTCLGGSCTIQFGDMMLQGIPEDFNEFVETAGASGGTDSIASILYDIGKQLEESGQITQSEEVKKLASIAHNISVIESEMEDMVHSCNQTSDPATYDARHCIDWYFFKNGKYANTPFPKPTGFDETYVDFPQLTYKQYFDTFANESKTSNLAYFFKTQLDQVESDSTIPETVKKLTTKLSNDISTIQEDFMLNVKYSGYYTKSNDEHLDYSDFASYNASSITDFKAAIICTAGNNGDSCQ